MPVEPKKQRHHHHYGQNQGPSTLSSAPPHHQQQQQPIRHSTRRFRTGSGEPASVGVKRPSRRAGPQGEEYLEGHGTPTPSEKVSRWHRDIFLMSPNGTVNNSSASAIAALAAVTNGAMKGGGHQILHPRQCLCEQCMAEFGTYKLYNQMLQQDKHQVNTSHKEEEPPAPKDEDKHVRSLDDDSSGISKEPVSHWQRSCVITRH